MKHIISDPALLHVTDAAGRVTLGGSQEWYAEPWHRRSGCGPTTGSEQVWYLVRRCSEHAALWDVGAGDRDAFLRLMDMMFTHITPGMKGVNSTVMFTDGIESFGRERGIPLRTHVLNIPPIAKSRPVREAMLAFLARQLDADRPVAFLNLSNGTLKNLDNWHWVLIISCDDERGTVTICDQGRSWDIDIAQWLRSSVMGGGFVAIEA